MDNAENARAKAKQIVAAIQDACDIAHGAATAWCPDEAEDLIAAALAALDGGEAVPVAWRFRWVHALEDREIPCDWQYSYEPIEPMALDHGRREVQRLFAHPPRSEVERAVAEERHRCAMIAYRICAESRHVTLGDKVAEAIRSTP